LITDDHVVDIDRCVLGKCVALILTVEQEGSPLIEINSGSDLVRAVAFAANGKYLVSGGRGRVGVWRVEDGEEMATVEVSSVKCLVVSKDGRWIAAGTNLGEVFVWDAKTCEKVFSNTEDGHNINGADFSPDSTRLVSASDNCRATIWNIETRERVQTLRHGDWVRAAKYSPQGDRIATATENSVRVWDSNNGHLLVEIEVTVTPWYNTGLLWFNDNLFVISESKIKQFKASTGSAVSEWPVPSSDNISCIAVPKHGGFIAYSTQRTITFWDNASHTQLGLLQHPQKIYSIAFSPDDRFLAIVGSGGTITIINTVSVLSCSIVVHINYFLARPFFQRA
jgi:WD40 repeat protein